MPDNQHMTAREVAELFGVHVVTVYRWVDRKLFDKGAVEVMGSPSGQRDRVIFHREKIEAQHKRESTP